MLICRFSIQDHHDLKLYRLSSTIKNFVEIKKTDSLACIGNDQNAQCGGCFGFSNVLFWLQKANASTLDRRQMKIYLNFTNQTTFILFVFLSSSFWNCITQGSHSYCHNAVSDQISTYASCSMHLLNLIHLPAQSAWKKTLKIWAVKRAYLRRFVFFDFSNSVCILWQVVRFQSEQEQDTSLDPKSRLWKGAISLSDSGTMPRLSSCPLPPPLKGIGLGTWGLNVAHLVIIITRAQCKV